ncbi:hypothetical protein D6V22_07915 [Vibrio cholerae]|nr:hypothetical protein [Vibrio cholerae]MVB74257.1 hypothetical protein [Vibrio cholerae]MVC39650.1 hypothetical protein [Vibrio cholerae]MVC41621.1 hypothetical protein [Vibrio cholerae]
MCCTAISSICVAVGLKFRDIQSLRVNTSQVSAVIPCLLEAAAVPATFVHPNHIVYLCSSGLTNLLFPYSANS